MEFDYIKNKKSVVVFSVDNKTANRIQAIRRCNININKAIEDFINEEVFPAVYIDYLD